MGVSRQRLSAMLVLVILPLCVASITALGLWRLHAALADVAEEYDELRELEDIDEDVSNAHLAMESDDPRFQGTARQKLDRASEAMVKYLADQTSENTEPEHQAKESREATEIIRTLHAITSADPAQLQAQGAQVAEVRAGLDRLKRFADANVRAAQATARDTRRSTLTWVITSSLACAGICIALLARANHNINQSLRELHQRLAAQAKGPQPQPARELGAVVSQIEELNTRMIEKIEESGREILRRERLAAVGVLAADVAHEINNPMNAVLGLTELGLRTVEKGPVDEQARAELAESLRVVRRESVRCKAIVERFMAMARTDRAPAWFDAAVLARETLQVAQAARPDRAACFVTINDTLNVPAFAPASEVRQILLTLLINAADAVPQDGRIELDATRSESEVLIRVRDNGRGLSDDVRRSLFTPFSSFSEHGKGLGLGLSLAHGIAASMNASLRAFSDGPGRGSTFVLAIPNPEPAP